MTKSISNAEQLFLDFMNHARSLHAEVEPIRVLRSQTFQIAQSNVLIRASSLGKNKRYFFGLNYINAEEVANLDNSYFAFICGTIDKTLIIPTSVLIDHLPLISRDRNGEYKITIDQQLNIALSGRGNRLDCSKYINDWDTLLRNESKSKPNTPEESFHSVLQGRLIEIGNVRGYKTFCPNKSKRFNNRRLEEISSLSVCPKLEFSDYNLLRQIDVLWFRESGSNLIPEYAFEVELTTGVWSGIGRMATLANYSNVHFYVISNNDTVYNRVIQTWTDYLNRYRHIQTKDVGELYAAELSLRDLRARIDL